MADKTVVAYIPVLHKGYIDFLTRHSGSRRAFYLLDETLLTDDMVRKDIRRLPPYQAKLMIETLHLFATVRLANAPAIRSIPRDATVIMPDDDLMREIAETHLDGRRIEFDEVFLRYDRSKSLKKDISSADRTISAQDFGKRITSLAVEESARSSDWWRRVGAVVFRGDEVIFSSHNRHLPTDYEPYFSGDPRGNFHRGEYVDLGTVLHAEAGIIAEAARKGISLEGAEIYVTTFPCPTCAKMIAATGIAKVFFSEGYSLLDASSIFKAFEIEVVHVQEEPNA